MIAFVRREIAPTGKQRSECKVGERVAKQHTAESGAVNCNYNTLHPLVLFQLRTQSIPGLIAWSQTKSSTLNLGI